MTPAICYNGKNFFPGRDFSSPEQAVEKLQNIDELDKLSDNIKLMEAFKTLTFSFNNGFQNLFKRIDELKNKIDEYKSTN